MAARGSEDRFRTLAQTPSVDDTATHGLGAHLLWETVCETIASRLSEDHSELLACPATEGGTTEWKIEAQRADRLSDLPQQARAEFRDRANQLLEDIYSLALRLRNAEDPELQAAGELLRAVVPAAPDGSIYVCDGQPAIVDWIDRQPPRHPDHVLEHLRAARATPVAGLAAEERAASATDVDAANRLVPEAQPGQASDTRMFQALPVVSLLLVLLLALLGGWLLLPACGLALPTFLTGGERRIVLGHCDHSAAVDAKLRREIAQMEATLDSRLASCEATSEPAPLPEPPAPPDREPVNGTLNLEIVPPFGAACAYALCNTPIPTTQRDPACEDFPDWLETLRDKAEPGQCRFVIYPVEFTVPAGTRFGGEGQLLINGTPVERWDLEGRSIDERIREALDRNGRPYLYWVGSFPWPYPGR